MSESVRTRILDYTILGEVSRGAMGIIYKVEKDGNYFALKALKVNDVSNILRFRKESASIARLNHPCLVKLIDANEFEGNPFIVMELLEGQALNAFTAKGPLQSELLMNVAVSVARALAEMHKYSMVHRDVKPANIMYTNDGRVKLLDLGLVSDVADLNENDREGVSGTILYSSPEQCRVLKRPLDARSDLYSLGITLFECFTGKLPFFSENLSDIIQMHAAMKAPDIREDNPAASPVLAAIINKLLEKDPDDRYQSAEGLCYDLENFETLEATYKTSQKVAIAQRDIFVRGATELPLVGRKKELDALQEYVLQARVGKGHAVVIEGEGGSGKSRLTKEITGQVLLAGGLVLSGKCQSQARRSPFAPIRQAFENMLDKIGGLPEEEKIAWNLRIKNAAQGIERSIIDVSSGFKSILGEVKSRVQLDDDSDKQRFLDDIVKFILNLSASLDSNAPTVVLIDDIQWVDPATGEVLGRLVRAAKASRVVFLGTARNDSSSAAWLDAFKKASGEDLAPSIVLGPLTMNDVRDIVAAQLGQDTLDQESIKQLSAAANGNPFVLTEFIRSLLNSGHLKFHGGRWQIDREGISTISLSNDVFGLVLERMNSLGKVGTEVLSVCSIVGNTFDLDLVINCSGHSADEVISCVQNAIDMNLLHAAEGSQYLFSHDRIREALLSSVEEPRRKAINDRLAGYLEGSSAEEKPWFDIARFYAGGNYESHLDRALRAHQIAGAQALANYAYQQAYELLGFAYRCAEKMGADSKMVKEIVKDLAIASSESGHEYDAQAAIDLALKLAADDDEVVSYLYIKLKAYFAFGRLNHSWITFKKILEKTGIPYPRYVFFRWVQINWLLCRFILKAITGWGFGRARRNPKLKKKIEELSAIYLWGSHTARFRIGNDLLWIAVHQLDLNYQLGESTHYARALTHLANILGNYRLTSVAKLMISEAQRMTENADPATKAYIKFQELVGMLHADDNAFESLHHEIGPDVARYLGPYEYSGWCLYATLRNYQKGFHREAMEFLSSHFPKIESLGNKQFTANALGELQCQLAQLGVVDESVEMRTRLMKLIDNDLKDCWVVVAQFVFFDLHLALEQDEVGTEADMQIDSIEGFNWMSLSARVNSAVIPYIRLAQLEKARTNEEKRRARIKLKESIHDYFFRSFGPTARTHFYILKSGLASAEGFDERAIIYAEKAYRLAQENENPLLIFRALRARAKIYAKRNDQLRKASEASLCLTYATERGWHLRATSIEREFNVLPLALDGNSGISTQHTIVRGRTIAATNEGTRVHNRTMMAGDSKTQRVSREERAMEALKQVGLASVHSINPIEQSKAVLDEVVRLFGAERAFLFLSPEYALSVTSVQKPEAPPGGSAAQQNSAS